MHDLPLQLIAAHAENGLLLRREFFTSRGPLLRKAALRLAAALARGHKVLLCGSGGDAAVTRYLAGALGNRYLADRPPLPAVDLAADASVITAIGGDFGFAQIFARQVRALGQKNDVLIGVSASGHSLDVVEALREGRERGLWTLGLTGAEGDAMAKQCRLLLEVPQDSPPLVQEIHIAIGHVLCLLVDHFLFENPAALTPQV